jgi:hypothetical protein
MYTQVVLGDVKCVVLVFALFLFISPSFDIDHLFFFNDRSLLLKYTIPMDIAEH